MLKFLRRLFCGADLVDIDFIKEDVSLEQKDNICIIDPPKKEITNEVVLPPSFVKITDTQYKIKNKPDNYTYTEWVQYLTWESVRKN